jgi:two-component system nitrogen regulation response regulator GlnG
LLIMRSVDPMSDSRSSSKFEELVNTALPSFVREAALVENGRLYRSVMTKIELPLLRQALELSGGNQLRAARLLGINRNTLRKRLRLLGLLPQAEARAPSTR